MFASMYSAQDIAPVFVDTIHSCHIHGNKIKTPMGLSCTFEAEGFMPILIPTPPASRCPIRADYIQGLPREPPSLFVLGH